jgi:hypothetical protein
LSIDKFASYGYSCNKQQNLLERMMLERTRLLSRAIKMGESALRSAILDMRFRRCGISSALRHCEKEIHSDAVIQARQEISELDRLINYITTAMSNLPQNGIARAKAIQTVIATVLELGVD